MKYCLWASLVLAIAAALSSTGCRSHPEASRPIRIRWSHDPENLDPLVLPNQQASDAANLLYCGLLQYDLLQDKVVPLLVEAFPTVTPVGDSLTRLSFRLRPQARWDDGQPVLAQDIDFTLKLMFCPGLPNEGARLQFAFIEALRLDDADPRRFTLVCRGQSPELAKRAGDFPVLSEASLDPEHRLRALSLTQLQNRPASAPADSMLAGFARRYQAVFQKPGPGYIAGCGPYDLVSWEKDQYLHFKRKPNWWADQIQPWPEMLSAYPPQLEYAIIPDDATASLALQRGEVDLYAAVPAREFQRLQRMASLREKLAFYSAPSYDVVTAGFNTRRPALADPATRRALSRLFDAAGLLAATQLGTGTRTVGLISPADRANYNDSLPLTPFDPKAAGQLLQAAGWQRQPAGGWQRMRRGAKPQLLQLKLRYRSDEATFETAALQFRAAAAQLGIPVVLQPTEASLLNPALHSGDFDLYVRTLKGNPFVFNFAPILHSESVGQGNMTGYGTPASDQLIEAVARAETPAQKAMLLRRFQARLQDDMPLVPLFFLPTRVVASRDLTGLHVSGLKPGYMATTIRRTSPSATAP
ncbi:hypothetical protein GCM10023185_41470 [Hymenobacter saemangeumensis]|uniref:Solute-binding protein family 5 domain-containing protein n=1 Tax=Hymenobacter saemangeumensis TaxID=1084522 RepID=A0ABP8ISC5_9BACT